MLPDSRQILGEPPDDGLDCSGGFPSAWRATAWRRLSKRAGSIVCPICLQVFTWDSFETIHMDHYWPKSLMGDSNWSNLRLLCGPCNIGRSNFIDQEIRDVLSTVEFRSLVGQFLAERLAQGKISRSVFLDDLLERAGIPLQKDSK